ncbi:MAG: hypothetical protein ACQKBW_13665 [Puniceicoccales bacterium]
MSTGSGGNFSEDKMLTSTKLVTKDANGSDVEGTDFSYTYGNPYIFTTPSLSFQPGEMIILSVGGVYPVNTSGNALMTSGGPGGVLYALDQNKRRVYPNPGYNPSDPNSTEREFYDEFSFTMSTQRIISITMYTSGGDFLSDTVNLHAVTPSGTSTSGRIMQPFTYNPSDPEDPNNYVTITDAVGFKFIRTFVTNNTTISPSFRTKWLANANPKAATSGAIPLYYTANGFSSNMSANPSFIGATEVSSANISNGFSGTASLGLSESGGPDELVLFDVPDDPEDLFSVGDLMHASLFYWNDEGDTDDDRMNNRQHHGFYDNLIPAYAIGNSLADPMIANLSDVYTDWSDYQAISQSEYFNFYGVHYDYSYLLNKALWDKYFFSTLKNGTTLNPRISLIDDGTLVNPDYDSSAASMMIDGAFNINSTSVEAWKALLATYWEKVVTKSSGADNLNPGQSPFVRLRNPMGNEVGNSDPDDDEAYTGYKALDYDIGTGDGEITDLAVAIVKLVRQRGPFTSLADFVNRALVNSAATASDDRLRGLLAQAIIDAGINSNLEVNYQTGNRSAINGFNDTVEQDANHWTAEGIPGWLTQADLLARLGSILSARSDTFRIRAYGQATDPMTESVVGEAWCEAIVQRVPEYVYSANAANTEYANLNGDNQTFGRRFKVVAFRWLDKDEL